MNNYKLAKSIDVEYRMKLAYEKHKCLFDKDKKCSSCKYRDYCDNKWGELLEVL